MFISAAPARKVFDAERAMMQSCSNAELSHLYKDMAGSSLTPLWEVLSELVTPTPRSQAMPHKWSYDEARKFLLRAGDLISAEEAERRVLILENPGLLGSSSITPSLYAGLQLVLPNEIAPCHRHSQCALRFVMEGGGAFTAVDGEKAIMQPFDLVLTPSHRWHDHGNTSDAPMIWLDGLDIPTVRHFEASFSEKLVDLAHEETSPPGDTRWRFGHNMRPFPAPASGVRQQQSTLFHYPYEEWRPTLDYMAANTDPDPHLGHAMEFTNPMHGGPIMPIISAHVRLLPAGFNTRPRRSSDGTVFVIVSGKGSAKIDEKEISLFDRDIFVVPSWTAFSIEAETEIVLFGFSDSAAQQSLNLFREQRL